MDGGKEQEEALNNVEREKKEKIVL